MPLPYLILQTNSLSLLFPSSRFSFSNPKYHVYAFKTVDTILNLKEFFFLETPCIWVHKFRFEFLCASWSVLLLEFNGYYSLLCRFYCLTLICWRFIVRKIRSIIEGPWNLKLATHKWVCWVYSYFDLIH